MSSRKKSIIPLQESWNHAENEFGRDQLDDAFCLTDEDTGVQRAK